VASLMYAGRTLALEWRSGKLFGITIDARYPKKSKTAASWSGSLGAPAASDLRRLACARLRTTRLISRCSTARSRSPLRLSATLGVAAAAEFTSSPCA
jgi:hypothetical protein